MNTGDAVRGRHPLRAGLQRGNPSTNYPSIQHQEVQQLSILNSLRVSIARRTITDSLPPCDSSRSRSWRSALPANGIAADMT
jgi:hypothetical protein